MHRILVAAGDPFANHHVRVHGKGTLVSLPCKRRRMIAPPLRLTCDGAPNLIGFDPLFAKATIVQQLGTFFEARRRYKRVDHYVIKWR